MWWSTLAGAALALAVTAAGYDAWSRALPLPTGQAADAAESAAAQSRHELGRKVYNFRCYFCHGYSGDAKTLAATYLTPAPRDFTAAVPAEWPVARIAEVLRHGRDGTAMKSFRGILDDEELQAVAAFVAQEFVQHKAPNTRYHTAENGWPEHQRYAAAFPFAKGDLPLDTPVDQLDDSQRAGRQLFVGACISCHDRARVVDEGPAWSSRPLSYPRMGFVPGQPNTPPPDVMSSASVYAKHEVLPKVANLSPHEKRGESLFQANCAFCHGADGTGKNWIGQFMEPKARDLTQYDARSMPAARLHDVIRDGLPGTSMPAWKSVLPPRDIEAVSRYVQRVFFKPAS
jgi:cytochrome c oxidase cbb3-type subunit 3